MALADAASELPLEAQLGLVEPLLVRQQWIEEHVPNIILASVQPLVRSACGGFATRIIVAHDENGEEIRVDIKYDLPPGGECAEDRRRRRMMHRSREEEALRSMDRDAAAAFHAKRASQRQHLRKRDSEICDVLDKLIGVVERTAEREANAWRCPDGCAPGADCARAAFRRRCVPYRRSNVAWVMEHTYCGDSGHEYSREKQHEMRCKESGYAEAFRVTDEMTDDFLAMWDGVVEPFHFWEPWLSTRTGEFLGFSDTLHPATDEFGWDHRPVGPTACARRGCSSCCYCRAKPPPPVRMLVDRMHPKGARFDTTTWMTIDELRSTVEGYAVQSHPPLEPLPAYLLCRRADEDEIYHVGGVIRVPCTVRKHVTADELVLWSELLSPASIKLQVLQADEPNAEELASSTSHLAQETAVRDERIAREQEASAWTKQARFNMEFGCGRRLRTPGLKPALCEGDLVYAAPMHKGGRLTQHGVAVVTNIHRVVGFGAGCPTDEIDLVPWDFAKGALTQVQHRVPTSFVSLFPTCCGEGASCSHLQETMQWPNGDLMSDTQLDALAKIPFQFSAQFKDTQPQKSSARKPSSQTAAPSRKRTITKEDRAAMKRMRARYTPKFFRCSAVRGSIRRHGAAAMEKVYSGLSEEAFRENGKLRETGDACPERDCKSDLSDSDDEPPMCLDGPDDA